jgi:hypothetical protein
VYCSYIAIVTGLFFICCLATAMHIPMDFPCHGWSAVLVSVCSRPLGCVGVVGAVGANGYGANKSSGGGRGDL